MPDQQTVARTPLAPTSAPSLAPSSRRPTRARLCLADALARRPEIDKLLQRTPAVPARRGGEPAAIAAAAALVRKFPLLSLRAERLYLRLCGNLPADGTARTFPIWRLQSWAGECSARTARALVRELTLGGVLPLIEHRPGRQGRAGTYRFISDPFRLLAKQLREREGIIERRERLRATRIRLRAEGSTAEACQRIGFNADWMLRRSCTASEMDALDLLFPPLPTVTKFAVAPLAAPPWRASFYDGVLHAGTTWTVATAHPLMAVTTTRYAPLIGSGDALEDSKALAIARIRALKARLL